jgi:hypothetical protein
VPIQDVGQVFATQAVNKLLVRTKILLFAIFIVSLTACGGRNGTAASATATSTGSSSSSVDDSAFCVAYKDLIQGIVPHGDTDIAIARGRVDALAAAAPAEIHDAVSQLAAEYYAVIDAFAAHGFDSQRVLTEASPAVQSTLRRLASEAQGQPAEPEATVVRFYTLNCSPTSSKFESVASSISN